MTIMNKAARLVLKRQTGVTMIEVLVSLLIIVLGLLGLAGMQVRMQQAEFESYQRSQALVLLYDMVDRINTHRVTASCFAFTSGTGTPYLGVSANASPSCGVSSGANNTAAVDAMNEWSSLLQGSAASGNAGAMVGARGCVSLNAGVYTVAVAWQGTVDTSEPKMDDGTTTINCGNNQYGSETRRRAVATTFRMAVLN
jgi:type IV pilus assembly protein PilV